MKDDEITTAGQLDAELVQRSIEKHRKLWKVAEGRFSWIAFVGTFLGATLLVTALFVDQDIQSDRLFKFGIGIFLILNFQIYWVQSKSEAIADLLKRLEQRVTHLERKTFADN